jgi:multiple sugar transport system substrate-binding protein
MHTYTGSSAERAGGRSSSVVGTRRPRRFRRTVLLCVVALVAMACGGDGGDTGADAEPAAELSDEQVAEMEEIGLDASRPYDGTEISFLLCCHDAPQFGHLIEKTAEFTDLTGIEVEFADVPYESFQERLTSAAVTGENDVVAWIDAWGPSFRGSLQPLDEFMEEAGRDFSQEYPEPYRDVVAAGDPENRTLGLPLRGHPFMSFYRSDVLEEHGIEVPETWEEHAELARTVSEEGDIPGSAKYYGITGGQNIFEWVSRMWSAGGDFFDENMEPTFNAPEVVEATEDYVEYIREDWTPGGAATWGESEALTEFVEGRAATFNGWWWMYGNMQSEEIAVDEVVGNVEFSPAPRYEGGESVTYAYLWPLGIMNQSDNIEASWEFVNWMTSEQVELEIVKESNDPGGAVRLSTQQDEEANEQFDGLLEEGGQILDEGRSLPMIPEWPEVQSILEIAINEMAGGADVQQQLDQAAQDVRSVLEEGGYY